MDDFEPGLEARVRQALPAWVRDAIDGAAATNWLPIATTRHLIDTVFTILGPERAPNLWRHFALHNFVRTPLLRTFIESMLRLAGLSPHTFIARIVRAWDTTYRDFGRLTLEPVQRPRHMVLTLRDLPSAFMDEHNYFAAIGGALAGFIAIAGVDPACPSPAVDPSTRTVRYEFEW